MINHPNCVLEDKPSEEFAFGRFLIAPDWRHHDGVNCPMKLGLVGGHHGILLVGSELPNNGISNVIVELDLF